MSEVRRVIDVDELDELELEDPTTEQTDLESRDRAVRATGFKAWLRTAPGEYAPLIAALRASKRMPSRYSRDVFEALLGHDAELVEMLSRAEAEWRADKHAVDTHREGLSMAPDKVGDYHMPAPARTDVCSFKRRDDVKGICGALTVPGTTRCRDHGGELVDVATRRAVLMTSWLSIVEATQTAVDTLVDVAENSRNDLARVAASKELLDRAGLTPELKISLTVESDERSDRLTSLKTKLDTMRTGLRSRAIDVASREAARAVNEDDSVSS